MVNIENLPKTKTAVCKKCGKEFNIFRSPVTGRWNYRTCCDECNGPEKTKIVKCQSCGKEFKIERVAWGGFSGRKYCDDCDTTKKETKTLICQKCGKKFEVPRRKNHGGFEEKKYCSNCFQDHQPTKTLICQRCGKEFTVDRYKTTGIFKYRKYCYDCASKEDVVTCKKCGKQFKATNTIQGKRKNQIFCPDCRRENWLDKAVRTCQEKYGVDYPCQRSECIESSGITISKLNKYFYNVLAANNIETDFEKIVGIYSYDLYVKNTNILIEINPTYTHNVLGNHFNNWKYDKNLEEYHLNKTQMAQLHDYRCIHIWQWDDWDKIIQMLLPKQKLYARNLQLKEVDKQVTNDFLNKYHLQSSCYGNQINLGLYNNDQLVQVMTFGKPRYNKKYQYELLRLCSHNDYIIVGGAEKLFKHFINKYQPMSVISYCDVSKFTGDVYERLGFNLKQQTRPQKVWTENNYKYGNNRYITDNLLRQQGYDRLFNTSYGKGTDNEQLMIEHGWLPVYDCGQKVFEWQKKIK